MGKEELRSRNESHREEYRRISEQTRGKKDPETDGSG
jgi:hypothetical protein